MKYEMVGDLEAERETGCYTPKSTPHDPGDTGISGAAP